MQTISELKEQAVTDTPLILFDCVPVKGAAEHWSTHSVKVGEIQYAARVLQHSVFEIQTASDQGVDGSPKISIVLANADSHFSEVERATGWKGAKLTASFVFYDLRTGAAVSDPAVVFQGICNPPEQIQEATLRLTAANRMNLQRLLLPQVRIQRRCPWTFPVTAAQQQEAVDGGEKGRYSLYYRCGYSAGLPGGKGNLNGESPFSQCGYTRGDCEARGMSTRFGGLEFVPAAIAVRSYGKDWSSSAVAVNQARYNDFVPMVYGTAWYEPPVVFARNDGNLTRMEVLLGIGQMQGVQTVLVNDIQIPLGISGQNMTGTGWYNVMTLGTRDGAFDPNFTDTSGRPAGDPYGSMAYLSVAVPNQINDGNSLPRVKVLVNGLLVPSYAEDGTPATEQFSSNPAWILLDVLRRSGWAESEIDIPSFAATAAYCDEGIEASDLNGNTVTIPRFQCNLVIQKRRSAGDVVRGIRNCARLFLTYGEGGVLQLRSENTIALQQPNQPAWSNSTQAFAGGWPSYEFGDGTTGVSGILRRANGEPNVTLSSRGIADTPNCFTTEFQDALNGYQQDSYTVVDADDIELAGQQVTSSVMALGLPHYDQAGRILKFNLDRSVRGNTYIQFESSIKAFGVRPGDLITVTYQKEGFNRQPFRVLKVCPATNYRTVTITAQIHDDAWYADSNGQRNAPGGAARLYAASGIPRPLYGGTIGAGGDMEFGIGEKDATKSDGSAQVNLALSFLPPAKATAQALGVPLINLGPTIGPGGSLRAGEVLYYAVSGVDEAGEESALSFIVTAVIPAEGSAVTLAGLSFGAATVGFNVYRGSSPANLVRIATNCAVTDRFVDTGLAAELFAPPDPNFDHANFYWRMESVPESQATIYSGSTIGNGTLQLPENGLRGSIARITKGKGAGQERTIASNTSTAATVAPAWVIEPDGTSWFAIAEAAWHFAAAGSSSPVSFEIPNLAGETVQVTGRAANANDAESLTDLAIVTRWQIGGAGSGDSDVPPAPAFGLAAGKAAGTVELSGISFEELANTHTISAGVLTVYYRDELEGVPAIGLSAAAGASDETILLSTPGTAPAGSMVQIEGEVLEVTAVAQDRMQYTVVRGAQGTTAAAHGTAVPVFELASKTEVVPFPAGFFGSPYGGSWSYPISLPDARIASGQLFMTNRKGNGPAACVSLTHSTGYGLRTLRGGQYSIQVNGFLAVDQSAAPALVVEADHSVRDVFAILGTAADSEVQIAVNVDGTPYCQLGFAANTIVSNSVDGATLTPLKANSQLNISISSVGQTCPGADLTVVIRL